MEHQVDSFLTFSQPCGFMGDVSLHMLGMLTAGHCDGFSAIEPLDGHGAVTVVT